MPKHYVITKSSPILFHMHKNLLTKMDVSRALNIHHVTLTDYINHPDKLHLRELRILAGLFGINILHLVLLLERNKPQINKSHKWYLESIVGDIDK